MNVGWIELRPPVLQELAVLLGAFRPPGEPMRRIGVLMYLAADDAEGQARLAAFAQALKQLGWSDGRNLRIDTRWANADDIRKHAAELAALAPDVLLAATGTATVAPLLQATRTVPIVFRRIPTADPPPRRQGLHSKKPLWLMHPLNLDEVLAALKNCLCTGCRTRMSA
jgi:hypothetical protein